MAEDGLTVHSRDSGVTVLTNEAAPPASSSTAISPPRGPNEGVTEIKAGDGKVYLSPMIDCHDGKIRSVYRRFQLQRSSPTGCSSRLRNHCQKERSPGGVFRPWLPLPVVRMAGSHGTVRPDVLDGCEELFASPVAFNYHRFKR